MASQSTDYGRAAANSLFFLGHEPGKPDRPIGYPRNYRVRPHLGYYGATNSGKSSAIQYALQQIARRRRAGFCLIDPHGAMYWRMVSYLRQHAIAERVLFWDINDPDYVVTYDPFATRARPDGRPEQSSAAVASSLAAALLGTLGDKSKDPSGFPQLKPLTEAGLRMLIKAGVPFLLGKDVFDPEDGQLRRALAAATGERSLLSFMDAVPALERSRVIGAPYRRFENLWSIDPVRLAFVSEGVDFRNLMEEGWLILINAEARREDAEGAYVFIRLLVSHLMSAAKRRAPVPSTPPFFLVIDEASRYLSGDIAQILAQTRKYSFYLIAGMQGLEQARLEDERSYVALRENVGAEVVMQLLDTEEQTYFAERFFGHQLDFKKVKHVQRTRRVIQHVHEVWRVASSMSWDDDGNERYSEAEVPGTEIEEEEIEEETPMFYTPDELIRMERARFLGEQRLGIVRTPDLREAQEIEIPRLKKALYAEEEMADWLHRIKASQPATMLASEAAQRFEETRRMHLERLRDSAPPASTKKGKGKKSTEHLTW